ncbi:MAG: YbhB/YbcL family Raf kinase inhibitor-like protein [Fusobacteriaceae bacterium]|nr:YbhB/YbcL family Raf kinase inhibitor-like protein [Fusobacteriaceae bacterium]MBN2837594.1 YbhB/YbcL family Raf kinase inhibitor-like protein [Fusobacteriaceae bacterium]
MFKFMLYIFLGIIVSAFIFSNEKKKMYISSSGIVNGYILEKYGNKGTSFNINGVPSCSIPINIFNSPPKTTSYAIVLEDKDAFPVTNGFTWIHWVACNIKKTNIAENESVNSSDFVQGLNSWISSLGGSQSKELSSFYGGMSPPDKNHTYTLTVYALDIELNLKNGFYINDMFKLMEGHILETAYINGIYRN